MQLARWDRSVPAIDRSTFSAFVTCDERVAKGRLSSDRDGKDGWNGDEDAALSSQENGRERKQREQKQQKHAQDREQKHERSARAPAAPSAAIASADQWPRSESSWLANADMSAPQLAGMICSALRARVSSMTFEPVLTNRLRLAKASPVQVRFVAVFLQHVCTVRGAYHDSILSIVVEPQN